VSSGSAPVDTSRLSPYGFETEDHRAMIEALDALCGRHLTEARLRQWDDEARYPEEGMRALAEAGWAGLVVPTSSGGVGASARDLAVVHRTIARHGLAPAQAYFSLWALGADAIARLGSDEQRSTWLPALAKGSVKVAFALTEPGAGSDAAAITCRARAQPGGFVVTGQKVFITGAAVADVIITAVRTSDGEQPRNGLSLLLIDPRAPGVTVRTMSKIGLHAIDLSEVFYDDVPVGEDALLGPLDGGWAALRVGLARERMLLAAICVGAIAQLVELSAAHARERTAFGRPIGAFQLVASRIVRMRLARDAADLLVARAAAAIDQARPDASALASIAKLDATEAYVTAARDAVQVFGGSGYTEDVPVARHYRDAKFMEIGGGTSEIQTMIIARSMGLG
jgi:alkylation response protein AidB-like acyl-CoA dehydrogenase